MDCVCITIMQSIQPQNDLILDLSHFNEMLHSLKEDSGANAHAYQSHFVRTDHKVPFEATPSTCTKN